MAANNRKIKQANHGKRPLCRRVARKHRKARIRTWSQRVVHSGHPVPLSLLSVSVVSLYLFSIPAVSRALAATLEVHEPVTKETNLGEFWQAIVVLGGGITSVRPEYGSEVPKARTLERVRFAVNLHKQTGLPILVSGGVLVKSLKSSVSNKSVSIQSLLNTWLIHRHAQALAEQLEAGACLLWVKLRNEKEERQTSIG